ncbi:MAG: diphosphate--fructose-6-phosphate 1-phosphotransferase [Candidatus Marinimicrobia bacterium]|nr:diphosphate--fructose-6-phosphate 1-phosphotransferase [Candidatus Neomarinimicrobiota bacterium]MDD5582893.1 diphosphate--fructose-6-phosphate 1-phosphotransferase [Candidatus Neomarinimicrobiota bacterium]
MEKFSLLQKERFKYKPKLPAIFVHQKGLQAIEGEKTESVADQTFVRKLFPETYGLPLITFEKSNTLSTEPMNVGVILSGGQAPGGHNVISGLYDGLKAMNPKNRLYGFLGGPSGLIENVYKELTGDIIDAYRNTGGFDIIGSGRTKLEKVEQFDKGLKNLKALKIKALVIIGGDDSNTNAGILAEYYKKIDAGVQIIGCPKTIDGDLKNERIEISFGFDTATKVYSELIGNIARDALSAKKYWHFIKLMGRSASHIALECGLKTQPNITLISEEVEEKGLTLLDIVENIANIIVTRADKGENFGVVLIPEGLIEFIPEMKQLIQELNEVMAQKAADLEKTEKQEEKRALVAAALSEKAVSLYNSLPKNIADQLIMDRDPHGNVQVSRIETEKLLIDMVREKLKALKEKGVYKGKFSAQNHFFGYEGRCAAPSNFDADYAYALGYTAAALITTGKTGYMASVRNLTAPASEWVPEGVPLTMMMNIERRQGEDKAVIRKALVDLKAKPFKTLEQNRDLWAVTASYLYPGPIQYFGPESVTDQQTETLKLEHK